MAFNAQEVKYRALPIDDHHTQLVPLEFNPSSDGLIFRTITLTVLTPLDSSSSAFPLKN
jgi:hypothetical protein